MSYKVLYRKYRPDNFDNVVGQDYTVSMLRNAISSGKNAHAYIFTGPRGTGKTSSAKVFAKALNCENPHDGSPCNECASCLSFKDSPDVIEIDAASNNGVDEIRELINNVKLVPSQSKYKVYIIDEVHMLTANAFNALLLTLEEPPSHVVFILATTDIQDVPITILSRCQRFDFKPISKENIISRLRFICNEESIKITDDALEEIALLSAGGMRDALGMLDQLSSDDEEITLDMVSDYFGSVSVKKIDELLTSISICDTKNVLDILNDVRCSGTNYAVFIEKLILELRKRAISIKSGEESEGICFDDIYSMIFDLNECLSNLNINVDPYTLIEIVLLKYINVRNNLKVKQQSVVGNNIINDNASHLGNKLDYNGNVLGNNITDSNDNSLDGLSNNEVMENKIEDDNVDKEEVINKVSIDINIRINNCFVNASKEQKVSISDSWVEFMNYLMSKDRNLISLLADTSILAASDKYVLIQSKISSTNELINSGIDNLERYYADFSGVKYRFAAINSDLWLKETEKYRFNLKNKIKYSYIAEGKAEAEDYDEDVQVDMSSEEVLDDLESLAKDIFGTYEVQ